MKNTKVNKLFKDLASGIGSLIVSIVVLFSLSDTAYGETYYLDQILSRFHVGGNKYKLTEWVDLCDEIGYDVPYFDPGAPDYEGPDNPADFVIPEIVVNTDMDIDLNGNRVECYLLDLQVFDPCVKIVSGGHLKVYNSTELSQPLDESSMNSWQAGWGLSNGCFLDFAKFSIEQGGKLTLGTNTGLLLEPETDGAYDSLICKVDGEIEFDGGFALFRMNDGYDDNNSVFSKGMIWGTHGYVTITSVGYFGGYFAYRFGLENKLDLIFSGNNCTKIFGVEDYPSSDPGCLPVYRIQGRCWQSIASSELGLAIDLVQGVRVAEKNQVQNFAYSLTAWGAAAAQSAATVTYTYNGGASQTLGSYTPAIAETATWLPEKSGTYVFTHQPGGLTATIVVPQKPTIAVESVRQQYPFNKVNVQYLIDDLDPSATYSVALKSVVDGVTNAVNIADLPATEGSHKVTFDAANAEVAPGLQNLKKKIKLVGELYAE